MNLEDLKNIIGDKHAAGALYEKTYECRKWMEEIPALVFPSGWKIQMMPPFAGAVVRFRAEHVSVYLDCYDMLGFMEEPYWEMYPNKDGDTERYMMNDTDGLLAGLERAIHYAKKSHDG